MPAPIKTYTPSEVKIILAQSFQVQGVVSVSLKASKEKFTMIPGMRGQNARVRQRDSSCILSIEVLQTSISNDVFSDLLNKDILQGTGRTQILLQDNSGTTKIQSENAYVSNFPDIVFSNGFNTRTWEIVMLNTVAMTVGGNSTRRPQFLEDALSFIK